MDAFDIVRLVAACVALVLGAIVFLVLFFRGMAWIDDWLKVRREPRARRRKQRRSRNDLPQSVLGASSRKRTLTPTPKLNSQVIGTKLRPQPLLSPQAETNAISNAIRKTTNSVLGSKIKMMVQLQCGKTIEPFWKLSSSESMKVCEAVGLNSSQFLVGHGSDNQILVVREACVQWITIPSEAALSVPT